jgi:hypothetical protein
MKKSGGHAAQALGRSRGGLSTKIHAGCLNERPSVAFVLTAGPRHESPVCETGFAPVPQEQPLTHAILDQGYDSNESREPLCTRALLPVLPPKSNRTAQLDHEQDLQR